MAVRIDNDVTLTHAEADAISRLLQDYATAQRAQAKRTSSAVVRTACNTTAEQASALARALIERLWTWMA